MVRTKMSGATAVGARRERVVTAGAGAGWEWQRVHAGVAWVTRARGGRVRYRGYWPRQSMAGAHGAG